MSEPRKHEISCQPSWLQAAYDNGSVFSSAAAARRTTNSRWQSQNHWETAIISQFLPYISAKYTVIMASMILKRNILPL